MQRRVFSRADVAQVIHGGFVPVRLNVDDPAALQAAGKYGVTMFPTYLVVDNGQEVQRVIGSMTADAFVAMLEKAVTSTADSDRGGQDA